MKNNTPILLALLLLILAAPIAAQTLGPGKQPTQLDAQIGEQPEATYHKITQQFESLETLDGDVAAFLMVHFPVLAEMQCELALMDHTTSPGGHHLLFAQMYRGTPIVAATLKVNLDQDLRAYNALSAVTRFAPTSSPAAVLRPELMLESARETFGGEIADFRYVWLPEAGGTLRYTLEVLTAYDQVGVSHFVYYDANTGQEVRRISNLKHAYSQTCKHHQHAQTLSLTEAAFLSNYKTTTGDTNGRGYVFMPDPLTSSGNFYQAAGGQFRDNNNATNPGLDAQRVEVGLIDLSLALLGLGDYILEGPHVKLEDISPGIQLLTPPVTSPNGQFFYDRSQTGFEDVMVYYHIDRLQRRIQSLGFNNLCNYPLRCDPHGANGGDNSFFVSLPAQQSYIEFGEGGVDDAEDVDVIVHEYGHALSDCGSPNSGSGFERRGLDEGMGDYIAASVSRQMNDFRWADVFTWDGHNEFWDGRSAATPKRYPDVGTFPSFYDYGEIWASSLMRAWSHLGPDHTDRVFFQSLYMSNNNMRLGDAAYVIFDADSMLLGGSGFNRFLEGFCYYNILSGPICQTASRTAEASPANAVGFHLNPNPAREWVFVNLHQPLPQTGTAVVRVYDFLGRLWLQTPITQADHLLELPPSLPTGVYIVEVSYPNGRKATQRLMRL